MSNIYITLKRTQGNVKKTLSQKNSVKRLIRIRKHKKKDFAERQTKSKNSL